MASKKSLQKRAEKMAAAIAQLSNGQQGIQASGISLPGGYVGGGYTDRFASWLPGIRDADGDSIRDLRELRARSRDAERNCPIATGAIETDLTYVVGTGLSLQSRINARLLGLSDDEASTWQAEVEDDFEVWAKSNLCDSMREQNFYELQSLAYRSFRVSGDSFTLLTGTDIQGWPYRLSVQIIEADRISNKGYTADSVKCIQGIEKDPSGRTIGVWICNRHPGAMLIGPPIEWEFRPFYGEASGRINVLHLTRKDRPSQTRGVPWLAPILSKIKQLDRYSDAEVDAAVNSAVLAVFATMDPEAFDTLFDDAGKQQIISSAQNSAITIDGGIKSGKIVNLLPGETVSSPQPGRPNANFNAFWDAVLKEIAMGLNMPYEVLAKAFNSSYSASRAALMDAWRGYRKSRNWLANRFCQPIYVEWLSDAVASGRISAPGFFDDARIKAAWCGSIWSGDGPGALDPTKEAAAAENRIRIGLTTLPEEIVAYDGGDWETKHRESARVHDERVEAGLEAPVMAPMANGGQAPIPVEDPGGDPMGDPTEDPTDPMNDGDPGEGTDPTELD